MMQRYARLAAIGLLLTSALATAQTPYTDDATYRALGGKEGIHRIVVTFVATLFDDVRVKESFKDFDSKQLAERLEVQFCEFSGGPCQYTGKYKDKTMDGKGSVRDMATVHADLKVTNAMFNAVTEDLQLAMEQHGIASHVQNKLIAKLAPMQRAIVTQ